MKIQLSQPITAADAGKRTITGQIVTWGEVGNTSAGPAVFAAESIVPLDEVTFRLEHDRAKPLGRATLIQATEAGMVGTFKVANTTAGTDALVEATEGLRAGLSVGVEVVESSTLPDGTLHITAALMEEVSLVTHPAIASAQVTQVAASTPEEEANPEEEEEAPSEPSAEEAEANPEEGVTVDQSTAADTVAEVTASVPRAHVQDPFPYRQGVKASFFRDLMESRHSVEASSRVTQAQAMITAAQTTTDVAEVIPPGYRPDLYVEQMDFGMPVASTLRQFSIDDATPFKFPAFDELNSTGLMSDHTEGVNPTDGTIGFTEVTVSPKAVSGKFTASREMLDAANPNLDAIILNAIREAYRMKVEDEAATFLESIAAAGTNAATGKVTKAVTANLAAYLASRTLPATHAVVASDYYGMLIAEEDGSGRPLNPYLAPSNANGTQGAAAASVSVNGLDARMAWSLTAKNAVVYRGSDVGLFTSGLQNWRWEEVAGPANIVFAAFGYVGMGALHSEAARKFTNGVA